MNATLQVEIYHLVKITTELNQQRVGRTSGMIAFTASREAAFSRDVVSLQRKMWLGWPQSIDILGISVSHSLS